MSTEHTASRASLQGAGVMVVFTVAFTALMALTYQATRPSILASQQAEKMKLVDAVLPPGEYDNALLDDYVDLGPTRELGLDEGGRVYRARKGGTGAALVIEAGAPDGYGGRIGLLVAIASDGRLVGVRVTGHRETPGLGDYIDPRKDRDKKQPWIQQFSGRDAAGKPLRVAKDGGDVAYRVGATISARAVTNAVGRTLAWTLAHQAALFGAPAGARI